MSSPQSVRHLETIVAKGKIFELVQTKQDDGRIFEVARRSPGIRLIICDRTRNKILLTKEFRKELGCYDYRLPGGKVFDSLEEYNTFLESNGDINVVAKNKAKAESIEETGIEAIELDQFRKSTLGATVEWDLFIFEVTKWAHAEGGQKLEVGEEIETENWFTYDKTTEMILSGEMQEDRIALVLLQWMNKQKVRK